LPRPVSPERSHPPPWIMTNNTRRGNWEKKWLSMYITIRLSVCPCALFEVIAKQGRIGNRFRVSSKGKDFSEGLIGILGTNSLLPLYASTATTRSYEDGQGQSIPLHGDYSAQCHTLCQF
jgi:hypothetical protein